MKNNENDKTDKKLEFKRNIRKTNTQEAFEKYDRQKQTKNKKVFEHNKTDNNKREETVKSEINDNNNISTNNIDTNFFNKRIESEKINDTVSTNTNAVIDNSKNSYTNDNKKDISFYDKNIEKEATKNNSWTIENTKTTVTTNTWTIDETVDYEIYKFVPENEKHGYSKGYNAWSGRGFMNKTYDESSFEENMYESENYYKKDKIRETEIENTKTVDCDYKINPLQFFTDLNLTQEMHEYLHKLTPTLVQKYAIPAILENKNVLVRAPTGLGKTLSFLVPLLLKLTKTKKPKLRVLIVTPTRELAVQIKIQLDKLLESGSTNLKSIALYGGKSGSYTKPLLAKGCDVLIATPGRLCDYVDQKIVTLKNVRYFVLDEADRMLEMGFENEMRYIRNKLNNSEDYVKKNDGSASNKFLRTYMFSATFDKRLSSIVDDYLTKNRINIKFEKETIKNIKQEFLFVDTEYEKRKELLKIVEKYKTKKILIFVDTKMNCKNIEMYLNNNEHKSVSLHGDKEQHEREAVFDKFIKGSCDILVATSVASRGLDIPDIFLVINFNLPNDTKEYIHRIGRSGRAGKKGYAISFFSRNNYIMKSELIDILKESENEIPNEFNRNYRNETRGNKHKQIYTMYENKSNTYKTEDKYNGVENRYKQNYTSYEDKTKNIEECSNIKISYTKQIEIDTIQKQLEMTDLNSNITDQSSVSSEDNWDKI